ncbi:mucin-17-like isoform X2 [Eriocheir sinensis]|uniref:mucin-17-like isoform X2 n=1 Tax=Eriocheir sinensis TaxID=95602 RepID=UPI0021C5C86C|nr:mucin-17-like isoform X2 [Eriocheir sinensis]
MAWVVVWACVGAALTQGLPLDHSPSPRGFIGFSFWPPAPDVAPVECAAANTLLPRGTCFKEDDCVKAGGVASGNCPSGGVCCVVPVLCGGEAKINNTWFVNKDFPAGTRDPASCIIRIKRSKAEVVQARLDLELMDLGEPVRGRCQGDALSITRPGAPAALTPTLCGNNSRQHLYVDLMPGEVEVRVRLDNAQLLPRQAVPQRQWKVLITQHTQKEAAPHGCLQYFRQARSTVRSLNYDSGLHLGDALNYDVCFSKLARSQKSDEACNRHFNDVNMEQRSLESVLPRNQPATKIRKTNRHGSSSRGREGNNNSGRGKNGNRSSGRGRNGTSNRRRFGRSASQPQTRQYREESDPKQYTEEDRVNFGVLDVLNLVNRTVEEVRVSGNTDQVDHNTIPLIDFPQNDIDDTPAEVTHPEDTIQENAILPDSAPMDSNIESSSPEDNNLLHVTPDQPITEARPIQLVPLVQSQTNEGVITQIQNVINQLQEKQKLQQQKDEEKTEDALTMTAATVIRAPLTPPPDGQDTSLDVEVPPPVTTVSDMSGVPASPPDSEHWDMKDTLSANDKPFPILHVIDDDVDVVLEKLKDQFLTEYLVNGNRPTETVGDILMDTMGVGLPGDGDSWVTAGMVVSAGNPTVPYTPLNDDLTDNLESSTTDETAGFSETAGESHATNTPQALNIDKYSEETDSTTDTDDESVTFSEAIAMEELTTFSPVIIPEAISEPTTELIVTRVDDNVTTTSNTTIEGGGELPIPLSMDTEAPQKDTHTDPKETSPGEHDPTTTTDLLTKTITFTSITTATVPVATTTTRTLQKTSSATTMAPTVSFTTIVITPATTMVTNTGPAPSTTSTTHLFTIPGFVQPTTTPTLTIPGSVQPSTIDSIALTTTFAIHTTSVTTSLSQTAITTPTSVMPTTSSMTPTTTTTTDSPGTGRPMQVELTLTDPESVQIVGDLVMADHSQSSTSKPHPFLDDEIEWLILDGSETSISLPPDTMVSSGIGFPGEGGQGTAMSPEGDEAESGDVTTEALEANTTREEEGESSCAVCEPTTSDDLHVGGTENDTTADDLDYQTSDIPSSVAASDITGAEAVEASSLGPATATEATGSQGMTTPSVTNECFNASDVTTGHTTSTSVETSTGSVAESDGQGSPLTTSPTTSTNITTFPSTTSTSITTFPSTTSTNITTFPSTTSTNSPSTTTTPTSTSITTFPSTTSTSSPSTSSTTTSTSITTFPSTTSTNSPSTTTPTTSTSITTFPSTTSTTSPSTTTPTTSTSITTFPSTTSTNSPSTTTTPTSTSITTFPSTTSTSTTTTSPATTPTTTEGNMGVNINIKVQGANSQEEIDDTSENIDAVINLITNSDWEPPELDETESEENSDDEENDSDDFESVESEEENEPELVCGGAYVMVRQRMLCGGQLRHNLPGQDTTDDRFEDVERFSVRTLHGATRSLRFSMSYETKCPRAPPPPSTTPAPTRKTVTLLQYLLGWYR